jgi:DNA repair protein RadB
LTCIGLPRKIPTGCKVIDKILGGGISSGTINLIYGEPETGKTLMAMQCAVNCARQGYKTLFVDCDGTFSAERLAQITPKDFAMIAEMTVLMRPSNFREQTMIIDRSADYITEKVGLMVFDTITSLYRVEIAESPNKTFELNRELNRQSACLAQVAKLQKIAVLMTSQVRTTFNEESVSVEPVAPRVLKFWADTIIDLRPTENRQVIRAILEKPKVQSPVCYLKIEKSGMLEYVAH